MTRHTDIDSLHYQEQEADHLRREGWKVFEPLDRHAKRRCGTRNCLTWIPRNRRYCYFCRKTQNLGRAARRRLAELRVVA